MDNKFDCLIILILLRRVNIIPNPASQRTFGDGVSNVVFNINLNNKQYICYITSGNSLYIAYMNQDGSNWISKLLYSLNNGALLPKVADIYQDTIYIVIENNSSFETILIKSDLDGNLLSVTNTNIYNSELCFFDFEGGKIYYSKTISGSPYYYINIYTTDLNGNNLVSNRVSTDHTTVVYSITKVGNQLIYFYRDSPYKYICTASSDLDCSNFNYVKSDLQCYSLESTSANDGSNGYSWFTTYVDDIFTSYIAKYNGSSFVYQEELYFMGDYLEKISFIDGDLYLIGSGEFVKYSSNLSYSSRTVIIDNVNLWQPDSTEISISSVYGNSYTWTQSDENTVYQLWTYPGDYIPPIPLPQVQCRATQIIASARTGKIIIPVHIL